MRRLERVEQWKSETKATARRLLDGERKRLISVRPEDWTNSEIAALDRLLTEAGMTWGDFESMFKPYSDAKSLRASIARIDSNEISNGLDKLQREADGIQLQIESLAFGNHDMHLMPLEERQREIAREVKVLREREAGLKRLRDQLAALERLHPEIVELELAGAGA